MYQRGDVVWYEIKDDKGWYRHVYQLAPQYRAIIQNYKLVDSKLYPVEKINKKENHNEN